MTTMNQINNKYNIKLYIQDQYSIDNIPYYVNSINKFTLGKHTIYMRMINNDYYGVFIRKQ